MSFRGFNPWSATIALEEKEYHAPTAIRLKAFPHILLGSDIVASAVIVKENNAFCNISATYLPNRGENESRKKINCVTTKRMARLTNLFKKSLV